MAHSQAQPVSNDNDAAISNEDIEDDGSHGGQHPLEILHEIQIWRDILEHVTDPKDMRSCSKVCRYLRDELRDKRTTYLLEEVILILSKKRLLGKQDFLNCRRVSRGWKKSVDKILQRHSRGDPPFFFEFFEFSEASNIREFVRRFPLLVESPIFTKTISFKSEPLHDIIRGREPWSTVRAANLLLAMWGSSITKCSLNLLQHTDSIQLTEELYPTLRLTLDLMPNLEILELYYLDGNRYPFKNEDGHVPKTSSVTLKLLIARWPLPVMKKLKVLNLRAETLPEDILFELMGKCPRLEKLVDENGNRFSNLGILSRCPLHMIKRIDHPGLKHFSGMFCQKESFIPMTLMSWPQLSKINILISVPLNFEHLQSTMIDLSTLFRGLERFQSSLNDLILRVENKAWSDCDLRSKVHNYNLPNLRTFELHFHEQIPLDFILPMSGSLKKLSLKFCMGVLCKKELIPGMLQIYSCWDHLYDSNVWQAFPKLETVQVRSFLGNGASAPSGWYMFRYKYTKQEYSKLLSHNYHHKHLEMGACSAPSSQNDLKSEVNGNDGEDAGKCAHKRNNRTCRKVASRTLWRLMDFF